MAFFDLTFKTTVFYSKSKIPHFFHILAYRLN